MTEYPVTTLRQAQQYMNAVQGGKKSEVDVTPYVGQRGEGDGGVEDAVRGLAEDLEDYSDEFAKSSFDSHARSIVHRNLTELDDEVLVDGDFWRYLSSVRFHYIVAARHPKSSKSRAANGIDGNWKNYGAYNTSVVESLFYRLYVGADSTYLDGGEGDPYDLSYAADVDLWQAHIVRVLSGDNPTYARNLVKWFLNREAFYASPAVQPLTAGFPSLQNPKTDHLRDLVKRVRRLRSNLIHEILDDEEMYDMFEQEARESLLAIDSWGRPKD